MEIRVFDHASQLRIRFPNVTSETISGRGLLYQGFGEPNPKFFLGFDGSLLGKEATFANPFWALPADQTELLPASQNDVAVLLSPEAQRLGARAGVSFNGLSPRIKIAFVVPPTASLNVGSSMVGFRGVWPLKGTYFCSSLQTQLAPIRKFLESYGAIFLRETGARILEKIVDKALNEGSWRIDAMDGPSTDFLKDNLVTDLSGMIFDEATKNFLSLKLNVTLPENLTNTYENNQDGLFTRSVPLVL